MTPSLFKGMLSALEFSLNYAYTLSSRVSHSVILLDVVMIPIPKIPATVATPVWFSPKMGPPHPIEKAPIKQTNTPNAFNAYCLLIAIHLYYSPFASLIIS